MPSGRHPLRPPWRRLPLLVAAVLVAEAAAAAPVALDGTLQALWDDFYESAPELFRFRLEVSGDADAGAVRPVGRFRAQFCPGRATKRPLGREVEHVVSDFDAAKFHFAKADVRELLLAFPGPGGRLGDPLPRVGSWSELREGALAVLLNVSPILRHHFVLAPSLPLLLPQVLTRHALLEAARCVAGGGQGLRLLYNSLGGAASVNHLHFQGYYLPSGGMPASLPIEQEEVAWSGAGVGELRGWPLQALAVRGASPEALAEEAFRIVAALLLHNVAHHVIMTITTTSLIIMNI